MLESWFSISLDNAEKMITNENEKLKECIAQLLNQIPQLSIILTSRKQLGIVANCVAPKIQFLSRLKAEKDVELFIFHADIGKLGSRDIYNLILADPKYEVSKVFPKIESL